MDDARGVECVWGSVSKHPYCPHGPTLLFRKHVDDKLEQFYACSACRDRKLCKFYLIHGETLTKKQQDAWEKAAKELSSRYKHRKLYIHLNKLLGENPQNRAYCHVCEELILISEKPMHKDHEITEGISDYQMNHPTKLLKPLDNAKKEAQYLFTEKTTKDITDMLLKLKAKQVLCIGTPKIYEYILEHHESEINCLLLDFDGRFHNFFGPLNYCWYNLMNHHFFTKEAEGVFKDFMIQNEGKDMYIVCDPPFGGRVEAISFTLKKISDLHKKWNNITNVEEGLKTMFIFPYFMESILQKKSNPPKIDGGLKNLAMADYKVDYINHALFNTEGKASKFGSPVRIFTDIPLDLLELPESDGYRYCKKCKKWVSSENKHCKKCKACTSKDGRTYKHCDICKRCVKPTWEHCGTCNKCSLKKHSCNQGPKVTGRCFKCNEYGHTENDCQVEDKNEGVEKVKKSKKHKINVDQPVTSKKPKLENENTEIESKKKKKKKKIERSEDINPETGNNLQEENNEINDVQKLRKKEKNKKKSEISDSETHDNLHEENNGINKTYTTNKEDNVVSKNSSGKTSEQLPQKSDVSHVKIKNKKKKRKSSIEITNICDE